MATDDSHNESAPADENRPNSDSSSIAPNPSNDSSVDSSPTRTYDGEIVSFNDATIISGGPPIDPDGVAIPPTDIRDIGKLLLGKTLDHFRLDEYVGGGGMGAVFRATDTHLERDVAVKILTHRSGSSEETVKRFRVEAQSAARLNHENIATVYFVGEDQGWNFIVFEFIEGENIRDLVTRTGPLDVPLALSCAAQIAAAIQHAAERSVVHRDIKPSNILVTPKGKAKLVDMGLARLRHVESGDEDLTMSGVTLGTFDYISPEQGRDPRLADVRSDLYSLGCTLYFMLTGQPPYPTGTVLQKLLSHTSDPIPDPRELRPGIPDDVVRLTLRLMEKQAKQRYQNPVAFMRDIATVADRHDYPLAIRPGIMPPPAPVKPSYLLGSLPWLIPTVTLILAVFASDALLKPSNATSSLPEFQLPTAEAVTPPDSGPLPSIESQVEDLEWSGDKYLDSTAAGQPTMETNPSFDSLQPDDPYFGSLGGLQFLTPGETDSFMSGSESFEFSPNLSDETEGEDRDDSDDSTDDPATLLNAWSLDVSESTQDRN